MKLSKKICCFALIFAVLGFCINSEAFDLPEFAENIFSGQEYNPSLSGDEIINYGLLFSCATDTGCKISAEKYNFVKQLINSENIQSLSEEERAEKILFLMYENILSKYHITQNRLDVAFEKGTYNCVTATVLYTALAKNAGLSVRAQKTKDHCFSTLYTSDGKKIDIETTNPYGFNPGVKKDLSENKDMSRYTVVPKSNYSNRLEVSDRVLVSLIAGNLTSRMIARNDYKNAVPLGSLRWYFVQQENSQGSEGVRRDLDVINFNYAKDLMKANRDEECLSWMNKVISAFGMNQYSAKNFDDIFYNLICNKVNGRKFSEGYTLLESGKNYLSEASFTKYTGMVKESEWIYKLNEMLQKGQYLETSSMCDAALLDLGNNKTVSSIKAVAEKNYAVTVHNEFVDYYNADDYDGARRVLEEGLQNLPGNKILLEDLKILNGN